MPATRNLPSYHTSQSARRIAALTRAAIESLENRQLLALLASGGISQPLLDTQVLLPTGSLRSPVSQLQSLLGPGGTSQPLGHPHITLPNGSTSYDAATHVLQANMRAIQFTETSASSAKVITRQPSPSANISIKVDSSGHLLPGTATSTDLIVTGSVKVGNTTYGSPLLT